jgi:ribonuclease HIII
MKKGKDIELIQRTKAEDDPAVAAASILARAEFLKRLFFLGQEAGIELPKGASPMVEAAAVNLVKSGGPDILEKYAKIHFKTTKRVLEAAR